MMLTQARNLFTLLFLSLFLPTLCFAQESESQTEQQSLFLSVEKALKHGDSQLYQKHRNTLKSYPLAGYLDYLFISGRLEKINQETVERFVDSHPGLPQSSQLQYKWLNWLAGKKRWKEYLQAHANMENPKGRYQCLKGQALLGTGSTNAAWQEAQNLWLTGKSQNKACDRLFSRWKAAGKLTQSLAAQRFWMAVVKNNTSLARYIDKNISLPQFKDATKLFWRIHNGPYLLDATPSLNGTFETHRLTVIHGIKRLASRDKDKALNIWLKLRDQYPFEQKQIASLDRRLAMKYAKNFSKNANKQIARIDPDYSYPEITRWRVRLALANENWGNVLYRIHKLPLTDQNNDRWRYWNAVALLKLNNWPGEAEENDALGNLGRERSFYGFLVADLSGQPFQLNHKTPTHQLLDLGKLIAKYQNFSRIKEWLYHKRITSAQSELNVIIPILNAEERRLLPYLAQSFEWHHQAIMRAARESMWNDLDLRFPAPQNHLFSKYAEKRSLDYPWVISIARQESAFNPMARSHAGARGLMQLMPATARQAARKSRISYRKASELYKPEKNIAIGTAHLAWLSGQYEGNKVFATAAYNAGGSAVRRWLKARGHLPLDIWIETIPYDETRRYVQNILAFQVIYSLRSNSEARMFSPGEAAKLALTPAEQTLIASNP